MSSPWQAPGEQPVPPVPPARPQYGELAPPGYVSPVPQPVPETAPQFAPPPFGQPQDGAHGQYYVQPPIARRPRTADVVVTCILLTLGLIGMLSGILAGAGLLDGLRQQDLKFGVEFTTPPGVGGAQAILIWSHVILYLAALGGSIPLMIKRRVAFWVPLTAGIIAAIVFWVALLIVIFNDPALLNAMNAANGR